MAERCEWRDLEADLRARLRGRRLVVEIGLTAALQRDVEAALDGLIRLDSKPVDVSKKAPALLAVCLVAHGVYRYAHGNYWDGFPIRAVDASYGPAFESSISQLNLDLFTEMVEQENAARYVARILAHGGIPKYCLGDYFRLLQHGLKTGATDAADLLTLWRSRRSAFAGIDRPVPRFLLFGRAISRDFLDRSIDLYRQWSETGLLPTPEAVGLPVAVITELRRLSEKGQVDRSTRTARRRTGPRPTLSCDPWDALGPTVVLPALAASAASTVWTVATDDGLHRERASATAANATPVGPSREWEVTLSDAGTVVSSTLFEGLDEVPVLFFSPRTGALVAPGLGLTAEDFWILRPADKELSLARPDGTDTPPRLIEVLPEPTGEWSGFVFEHVDLAGATAVKIGSGGEHRSLSLRSAVRPILSGSFLVPTIKAEGRRVCVAAPRVEVPAGDVDWQVRVSVEDQVHSFEVPAGKHLDLDSVLPADRGAAVAVAARGVLGSDLREEFCWIPGLHVGSPERLALPDDPPPSVVVESPAVDLLGQDVRTVRLRPERGRDTVDFVVTGTVEPLTLTVQLPVLRWGPVASGHIHYGSAVVPLSTLDFLDGAPPPLAVSTGQPGTLLALSLEVGGRPLQSWEEVRASGARGQYRYDLARITDTVRMLDERANLLLRVGDAGIPVRIATITPQFEFSDLHAAALHDGDTALVVVTFTEHRHANGRVLRLWPRHRPWARPISQPVPDEATSEAQLVLDPAPPLGEYLAELSVEDGFSVPVRPGEADSAVTLFQVGDDEEVTRDLAERASKDPVAVVESILVAGRPARILDAEELRDAVVPALLAWASLQRLPSRTWNEQRAIEVLPGLLGAAAPVLADGIEEVAEDGILESDELLRLAVTLAPRLHHHAGAAPRSTWRLAPGLACLLDLSPSGSSDEDVASEFLGWSPSEGLEAIDEADEEGRISQRWLGMDRDTLELIRRMLQFEVRPRPLSQDGRIAATFEWLKANGGDGTGSVERWRSSHHHLARRPVPTSEPILRHLAAREPARGSASWGDFGRLTLLAALHLCGRTTEESAAERALLEATHFAPQQVRRDLALGWILTNDLIRQHGLDRLPTEILR